MGVTGADGDYRRPGTAEDEPWPETPPPRPRAGGGGAGRLGFGVATALALAISAALLWGGGGDDGEGRGGTGPPSGEQQPDGTASGRPPDTSDGARYTLEPPAESGGWTRSYLGDSQIAFADELEDALGLTGRDSVGARYADRDLRGRDWVPGVVLAHLNGFWGQIEDPVAARDTVAPLAMAAWAEQGTGARVGKPLSYAEGDVAVTCWQIRGTLDPLWNYRPTWTECLWTDYGTVALVTLEPVPPDLPADWNGLAPVPVTPPLPVSLKEAAEVTEQLRADSLRRTAPGPKPTGA
ncbi:hypothetical protein [Streptomyces aidingensis]|uniref:Uncharacterized protein n=1 Tax=Streptomyces aidingensis TaxID=910347 RepID=A0A1I1FIP5_9ACTN|nr:hypothetical protein [Streptomyces aidingensis]SFB98862.1 hypothetical protein SAMN05421773_101741 [Streptomyces aidingensis]